MGEDKGGKETRFEVGSDRGGLKENLNGISTFCCGKREESQQNSIKDQAASDLFIARISALATRWPLARSNYSEDAVLRLYTTLTKKRDNL